MKVWMKLTEAELADTIAKSYLDDVTHVVDDDPRLSQFALEQARRARAITLFGSETGRAEAVGEMVRDALSKMLSEGQQLDALGALLTKFLGHVSLADLGSYYLRKYEEQHPDNERLTSNGQWSITQTMHEVGCAGCLAAAESAAIHAAVTGSVGASFAVEHMSLDGTLTIEHDAAVERNKKEQQ